MDIPPPLALLFYPLSSLDYDSARVMFLFCLIAICLLLVWMTESLCVDVGVPFNWTQLLILLMGFSNGIRNSIVCGNISPLIGIGTALVLRGFVHPNHLKLVAGYCLAGMTKGVAIVWCPLLFMKKAYKTMVIGSLVGIVLVGITFVLGARWPLYEEFVSTVIPSGRGHIYMAMPPNVSLLSMCSYFGIPVSKSIIRGVLYLSIGILIATFWASRSRLRSFSRESVYVPILVSLCIFHLSSNICWEHYATHFFPLVPFCFASCIGKWSRVWLAAAVLPSVLDPGIARAASIIIHSRWPEYGFTIGLILWLALGEYLLLTKKK